MSTIGIDFGTQFIRNCAHTIKLQIWDFGPGDWTRPVRRTIYRNALGVMIVYDLTKSESFRNVAQWLREVELNADKNISILLVGTKVREFTRRFLCTDYFVVPQADLTMCASYFDRPVPKEVTKEQQYELSQHVGIPFIETSSKLNINVDRAFFILADMIYKYAVQAVRWPHVLTECCYVRKLSPPVLAARPTYTQPIPKWRKLTRLLRKFASNSVNFVRLCQCGAQGYVTLQ